MTTTEITSNLPDVINRIFFMARREKVLVRPMKLQKLLFFSYGWYAGKTGNMLFGQGFQAWPYGPVIPLVYNSYKGWGSDVIDEKGKKIDLGNENANSLVDAAVTNYGHSSDMALSDITHKQGSPWLMVWVKNSHPRIRETITFESIRDFYKAKLDSGL